MFCTTHADFVRAGLPASVAQLTALTALNVSRNSFGAAGAQTVAKVLARCVNLRSLAHAVGRCMYVGCCYPLYSPLLPRSPTLSLSHSPSLCVLASIPRHPPSPIPYRHPPTYCHSGALEAITFGDKQAVTMKTDMTEADLSGKQLGASGAIIAAAFLPKCQ